MKVGAMTKARIGFAVGLGIGIGLVEAAVFYHVEVLQRNVDGFCFVAAATGFLGWLVGGLTERKGMESPVEARGAEQGTGERPLTLLSGLKYFGLTLMVSTGPLCTLDALRHNQPAV